MILITKESLQSLRDLGQCEMAYVSADGETIYYCSLKEDHLGSHVDGYGHSDEDWDKVTDTRTVVAPLTIGPWSQ